MPEKRTTLEWIGNISRNVIAEPSGTNILWLVLTFICVIFVLYQGKKYIPGIFSRFFQKKDSNSTSNKNSNNNSQNHPPLLDGMYIDDNGICRDHIGRPFMVDPENKNKWFLDHNKMQTEIAAGAEYNYPDIGTAIGSAHNELTETLTNSGG